jgi:hypothetical protein
MPRTRAAHWPHWPWLLWAVYAAALAALLLAVPRLPQPPAYHAFADARALAGIPRFGDVASNVALLLPALWGLRVLRRRPPGLRSVHGLFFAALACTALGSAFYHWAPDTPRLFWDRLPLGLVVAGFPALVLADRAPPGAGRGARVARAAWLALGPLTVLYWRLGEALGLGDLRPYALLKAVSLLAALALLAALPPRHTRGGAYAVGLALYGLASLCEHLDAALFAATGWVSGHTLKHLAAGLAVAALAWMLARRQPLPAR